MKVAMLYDDDAYVEQPDRRRKQKKENQGLWGRHVAGREFLDAYLTHGTWRELAALVRSRGSKKSLVQFCKDHPSSTTQSRRLRIFQERNFLEEFCLDPPAPVLYTPQPPDERYAWARQHAAGGRFAICGLTHTLCSARANRLLLSLMTAPFEEHDALICTSRSVISMVTALLDNYGDYLKERFGGSPRIKPRLELIPLGVNTDKFRPASPEEKATERAAFEIHEDEVAVLFVGRFAAHGKAHPFPIYHGLQRAAERTKKKIHLLLSGWASSEGILQAFIDGAQAFAPDVRLTIVDGTKSAARFGVWKAADIFTSLSDNIQETFGLVIVEAMASGLPVVASDWNGYRDLVVDRETGYLVPTIMVPGATQDTTANLLFGAVDYDRFIGACNQTTIVDNGAAADAFTSLVQDATLRAQFGAAGRRRAEEQFAWPHIIKAYEELWRSQAAAIQNGGGSVPRASTPAAYPPPESCFHSYPTHWLDAGDQLVASADIDHLQVTLDLALTNYGGSGRVTDRQTLREIIELAQTPRELSELAGVLAADEKTQQKVMATIGWMLKYGLLQWVRA